MITNAVARRYAKALVQLGAEEGAVEKFNAELTAFNDTLADNPDLDSIFRSPGIRHRSETRNPQGDHWQAVAVEHRQRTSSSFSSTRAGSTLLPQIAESYSAFADELSGVIRPTLASGLPLDDAQIAEIKAALEKSTGKKVVVKVEVDPSLIGGVVTKIGDKLFDGSVRTQLNRIEDILQKG